MRLKVLRHPSAGDAGCALRLQQHAGIAGAKPSAVWW